MAFSVNGSISSDQIDKLNMISNDAANATRKKSQVLDKDAFLKLMMTQLQNQNPLEPTDNAQYMAQMAQFSSVEQLSNIASSQESNNKINSLMSVQLESMTALLEKISSGDIGGTGSDETSESQTVLQEQNAKILEELVKMNATLAGYFGSNSTNQDVSNEDVFSLLGI